VAAYSTFDAKAKLSEILDRVAEGEEITITRHGRPVAKIVPAMKRTKRILGGMAGTMTLKPGWDAPITEKDLLGE